MTSPLVHSVNPATLETVSSIPTTALEEVPKRVLEAKEAFKSWSQSSFKERAKYLLRAREYLLDHLDDFARVISEENGKPLVEALSAELFPVTDLLQYFAKNAEKLLKPEKINIGVLGALGRKSRLYYQPIGVVGIISPWNFPFSIPMSGVVMSLAAGNCVVLKPADATPRIGKKIEELMHSTGLPVGVFTHIAGGPEVGEALLHSDLNKVIFTGSVRVGKRVMEICAKNLVPCTLELGGKDPMIVLEDAHLDHAAAGAVWGAFTNCGQVCASVERVYVHESIASAFIEKVVEKTLKLRQGPSVDFENDIGPLTTAQQLKIVEEHVLDAKNRGATILTGGERNPNLGGYFYPPTVLKDLNHDFRCVREETFGPLMPIMTFKTDEEAIHLANDSIYGLTASVWTQNLERGRNIAQKIRAGTVTVNDSTYTYAICQTPWGGIGHSGFGRTHGKVGLHELVHLQHIHENRHPKIRNFWWFGYNEKLYRHLKILARNLTGSRFQKLKGILRLAYATMKLKKY